MKKVCFAILIFLMLNATSALSAEKAPTAFPDDYFDGQGNATQSSDKNLFENGKSSKDKFINFDEYNENYKGVERGNDTKIVKCPCKSGKSCTPRACHAKEYKGTDGKIQYRFVPVPTETDEQINPYFMMLSRQRLLAQTSKDKAEVKDVITPLPAEQQKELPKEYKEVVTQPKPKRLIQDKGLRFYRYIMGGNASGNTKFRSSETLASYTASGGLVPGTTVDNFTVDKNYQSGKSFHGSIGGGFDKHLPRLYSNLRGEVSINAMSLSGDTANLNSVRKGSSVQSAFDVQNDYGNMKIYTAGIAAHLDVGRDLFFGFYPSVGYGIKRGRANFDGSSNFAGSGVTINSLMFHMNYDIDANTTIFAGVSVQKMKFNQTALTNYYTDRDTNSSKTAIYDDRLAYNRTVNIEQNISLKTFDIGFRFY